MRGTTSSYALLMFYREDKHKYSDTKPLAGKPE